MEDETTLQEVQDAFADAVELAGRLPWATSQHRGKFERAVHDAVAVLTIEPLRDDGVTP